MSSIKEGRNRESALTVKRPLDHQADPSRRLFPTSPEQSTFQGEKSCGPLRP